jgi:archaellin
MNHYLTERDQVTFDSLLKGLSIGLVWTFSSNESLDRINEGSVGEAFDKVLTTDADDVCEAHYPVLDSTKIDVMGLEEAFQRHNEGVVIAPIVECEPTDEGSDTGTVEQLQNNGSEVGSVMFASDVVECDQGGLELQLLAVLVAGNPMGHNADVGVKILVQPEVGCKANLPNSISEFEPQGLEMVLPGLNDCLTQLGAVRDVFVLKV